MDARFLARFVSRLAAVTLVSAGLAGAITIQGTVLDAHKKPVPKAAVWIMDTAAWPAQRGLTDSLGRFRLSYPVVKPSLALRKASRVLVRKAGFEAQNFGLPGADTTVSVVLAEGRFEKRIDSVMATMSLEDKFGQMDQALITTSISEYRLGSVLSGGTEPVANYDSLQSQARKVSHRIPVLYGIDAVHGHAKLEGATVLPHNIGLGATRDTGLLRRLGELTAKEMWAGNADWAFAPCIAVARDIRWGRTYESYGELPELGARLGAAYVKGLQGDGVTTPWRVVACAKHFVADGGTTFGTGKSGILNAGDAKISQTVLDSIHLPVYLTSIAAGANTVMASFNAIEGLRMHRNKALLTDTLKTDFAFDGFVVSDWEAIKRMGNEPFVDQVEAAVNAGVDMSMEPRGYREFLDALRTLVKSGKISQSRIDDAVRRILRVKFRQGLFASDARRKDWDAELGSADHRSLAREAVRKSLVLLKNDHAVLPLPKQGLRIAVVGTHADNTGLQCGGWTRVNGTDTSAWTGAPGVVKGATSILAGMRAIQPSVATDTSGAKVVVVVAGEQPYSETSGDSTSMTLPEDAAKRLAFAKKAGQKTVLVVVSGRPVILGAALADADAVVAAWLPGSEGEGVGDVLFGDFKPVGKLPVSWPARMDQVLVHPGDLGYAPLFSYGYGLTW